jgi:Asp-tRNA(Asn)/Glu-tRNA(Gln) amidotransferase A subunit family amidase
MPEPDSASIRRRSFLACCSSLGLGSSLFPGALWAQSDGGKTEITSEMIVHAAQLVGLEFSKAECDQMLEGIRNNRAMFGALREISIDQNVPPPLYFNPTVPGQKFNNARQVFQLADRSAVTRPDNLEDVAFWPVTALSQLIETRQVTATELTRMYLARIERHDPVLRCVITLTKERALNQAKVADEEIARGRYRGLLHGIPWGVKDLLAVKGYRTTWGFKAYEDQMIDMDATVVERLDNAGAILIAKLSTGEIARGDQWLGVQTKNPWKTDEGSGGSSAGPASATAAGLVGFSIGTDTTGSILGPSQTCGITGLRPTFGRVSRHGVMPVCWSLDKVGPMCRSVEDCALVFDAILGPDEQDLAVVDKPFNWDGNQSIAGIRVGYLQATFERQTSAENATAHGNDLATLGALRNMDLDLVPVTLPEHADMDALQLLLVDEAAAFDELLHNRNIDLFRQDIDEPEDVLMRIARLHPAVEYLQINRQRMLLMQGMARIFQEIDVLVAPSSGSPVQSATSLTGHPAVAVHNGFDDDDKPTGIQFIGQIYGEARTLALAGAYQESTGFHKQHPREFV